MEDLDSVQDQINDKLEHGFDTRHIYQMFSTFVATIKNQANQIEEMQEHAERAEAQIENMAQTIRTMEMNIQGFVTLPPDDEDDGTLTASRRPSLPRNVNDTAKSTMEDSKYIKPNQWEESNSRPPSSASVRSGRRNRSARSWKYKKRRIIRQVSLKLREEVAGDSAAEQDENITPQEKLSTTGEDTSTEMNHDIKTVESDTEIPLESIPDTSESIKPQEEQFSEEKDTDLERREIETKGDIEQTNPSDATTTSKEELNPRGELSSSPRGEVSQSGQESPRGHVSPTELNVLANDQAEPIDQVESPRQKESAGKVEHDSNRQVESTDQIEPMNSGNELLSKQTSPRADASPTKLNTSDPKEISGKPPTGRNVICPDVTESNAPQARVSHGSKRSSRDRDMKSVVSRRTTPEYESETPPLSHRSRQGYYDDVPQIDPTQTVNYRIGALEARLAEMTDLLEAQQHEFDKLRRNPPASRKGSARNSFDIFDGKVDFKENSTVASQSFAQDVEEADVDRDINVREEVNTTHEQQDDIATVVKKEKVASHHSKQSVPRAQSVPSDVNVLRYNDQKQLPESDVEIISAQVCTSVPMRRLLDRFEKSTEKAIDHGIKRLPKPPPQVTANELLTDSIVSGIANSMLRRGLLDELRHEQPAVSQSPRELTPPAQQMAIQQPTPTESSPPSVTEADLKAIADAMVTKNEILAMIKDQIKRIPPQISQPSFSFTPYAAPKNMSDNSGEVTIAPKKYQEMTDDIPDADTDPVEKNAHQHVDTDPDVVREATMGERAKTVLEQHVDVMEHDKASNSQLEALARNMTMHVTMEVQKISSHYEGLFEQLSAAMNERQESSERGVNQLRQSLYDLEASLNAQIQHMHRQQPNKKKDEEAWKSDLLKVSQSINKAREDQRTVAKMLVEELENLQNQMKNRVDESRLEHLAQSIEEKVQQEMGQSVSGINSSMAKIIAAVRSKADRSETEGMIQKKIREAEESLRILQDDEEPAGAFKCISCGTGGKRMSPNASLESLSFASVLMSQSAEVQRNRGGDLDQTAAVLNRQAGLRPVSRQQKPMTPKVYTPTSAPTKEMTLEPLYRRAKHANNLREIPKIPNVTFGVGNSNQYKMDERNEAPYFPNIGTQSAPTSKQSMTGGL